MKRRWFGVALALWAVVAPLIALVSAPVAYADGEQWTLDIKYNNGVVQYFIRGINGNLKSGAELYAPTGVPNIGGLPAGTNAPNHYSSTTPGALDGGCGDYSIINISPSGTPGVFNGTLNGSSRSCPIAVGAIKVYDPNNVLGTGSADAPVAGGGTGDTSDDPPDCDAGPSTFLVCDFILKPLLGAIDWIRDNFIVPFLREKPLDKNDKDVQPVYKIWASLRNVASVFFILVFFLVIFGTAIGWDNYTVKKILPRLIAGAILVPFSWYICVILIDAGNILGQGLVALISPLIPTSTIDFSSPLSKLFLGTALVGVGFVAFSSISAGVVISLFITMMAVFLTLVMRKILIILFVVLSPLAVLAWILPNTSKWFREWWTNLFKLVMMYPIIMLLFEAGRLFAATAGATFGNGFADKALAPIIQVIALMLPLAGVPFAAAMAGKGLGVAGNAVGKVMNAADKQFGKGSDTANNLQNRMAAHAADKTKGNKFTRGLTRLGSGTAGIGAGARAGMHSAADKHIALMSHDAGHHKAQHDILDKARKLDAEGKTDEADELRRSISTPGRIEYGGAQEAARQAKAAGDIQGYNKAMEKEIPEAADEAEGKAKEARARSIEAKRGADEARKNNDVLKATILDAEAEREAATANTEGARAKELRNSLTTVGQMKYDASKAKSAVIADKGAVVAYQMGKAELDATAKASEVKEANARNAARVAAKRGDTKTADMLNAEADKHRDEAQSIRAALSTTGKMRMEVDQGRDKMIADKAAIKAHLEAPANVEATAQAVITQAQGRAAELSAKAAAATRHAAVSRQQAQAAADRGDGLTANILNADADKAEAEAAEHRASAAHAADTGMKEARIQADNIRRSLTTAGKLNYQTEQGTRRILGEKAQQAAFTQAHDEIEATAVAADQRAADAKVRATAAGERAAQLRENLVALAPAAAYGAPIAATMKADADRADAEVIDATAEADRETNRAVNLRQNLTSSGRMAMQVSQEKQNVVAEQAKLEALRRANEISSHDTGRQLEAQASVQAKGVLETRTQEAEMEEVVIRDKSGQIVTRGKVGNVDIGSDTVRQFKEEATKAMRSGDHAKAAAYLKSLTRTSSGRDALRSIQYEEFGGNDNDTIQPDLKDLWERAVGNNVGDKAPDLKLPRIAAFTDVKPQDFLKFDKRTKKAYLDWVMQPQHRAQYAGEAANAIAVAASERLRSNLDDADIQFIYDSKFMQEQANLDAVKAVAKDTDFQYLQDRSARIKANPPSTDADGED